MHPVWSNTEGSSDHVNIDISFQANAPQRGCGLPIHGVRSSFTNFNGSCRVNGGYYGSSPYYDGTPSFSYYGLSNRHPNISFRPILPGDHVELKKIHESLFPIKYEAEFYNNVVYGRGIISWAAVDSTNSDKLIGFVTAKVVKFHEVEDAAILGFELNKNERTLIYILTLGVIPSYRKLGIASSLVSRVKEFGARCHDCRAVYLHVIAYNHDAISFYQKNHFRCLHRLSSFYLIDNVHYDAFVYAFYVNGGSPPYALADFISSSTSYIWSFLNTFICRIFKIQKYASIRPIEVKCTNNKINKATPNIDFINSNTQNINNNSNNSDICVVAGSNVSRYFWNDLDDRVGKNCVIYDVDEYGNVGSNNVSYADGYSSVDDNNDVNHNSGNDDGTDGSGVHDGGNCDGDHGDNYGVNNNIGNSINVDAFSNSAYRTLPLLHGGPSDIS